MSIKWDNATTDTEQSPSIQMDPIEFKVEQRELN